MRNVDYVVDKLRTAASRSLPFDVRVSPVPRSPANQSCIMTSSRALSPCSELERAYRETCKLPKMPKKCPQCKAKVQLCHINLSNDGVHMCTNIQCEWPVSGEGKLKEEEFMGFSDIKLYHRWQEALKKKKKRCREAQRSQRTLSITSDSAADSDKDESPCRGPKPASIVRNSQMSSIFDVQEDEAESGHPKEEPKSHGETKTASVAETFIVPDISAEAQPSTSPVAEERDNFLLPERPLSEMTPKRKDNSFVPSDSEDYGDISDAEPDLNIFTR